MTLQQVAERTGLDPEQLGLLEGSDYPTATLGTMRAYCQALEATWGWTLTERDESASPSVRMARESAEIATPSHKTIPVGGIEAKGTAVRSEAPLVPTKAPWVFVEGGMTIMGNLSSRHRKPEAELNRPTVLAWEEDFYAGV